MSNNGCTTARARSKLMAICCLLHSSSGSLIRRNLCRDGAMSAFSSAALLSNGKAAAKQRHDAGSATRIRYSTASSPNVDSKRPGPTPESEPSSLCEMMPPNANPRTVEQEILRLGRSGRTEEALALYRCLWNPENNTSRRPGHIVKPSTRLMNGAIDACVRARPPRIQTAFELLEHGMRGGDHHKNGLTRLFPNVFTFGALMSCCARARDGDRAIRLLTTMKEEYNVQPNAVVYSTAISACERSIPPKPKQALHLLREATFDDSLQMSVVGYNAAMSALARAGEWKTAIQLLDEMEAQCLQVRKSKDNNGDTSTGSTWMSQLEGCERNKKLSTMTASNKELEKDDSLDDRNNGCDNKQPAPILHPETVAPPPDEVTYGTVMAACERSGEWREVLRFANVMQQQNICMDGMAITTALHACQQLGLAEEAMRYLTMMKGLASQQQLYDKKEVDRGEHHNHDSNKMRGRERSSGRQPLRGPDSVAYRLAISACARCRNGSRWADGIRLLNEMKRETGITPDVIAYTAAIGGCAEAGEWKKAFSLLDEMQREGVKPNVVTYSAVIGACARASAIASGRRDDTISTHNSDLIAEESVKIPMKRALELLNQMRMDPKVADPNIVSYNAAIRACAEGLNLEMAFQLLEDLKSDGLQPTVVTCGSLMTACERVGSVEGAALVFRMLKAADNNDEEGIGSLKPNEIIYGAAISLFRKTGQPDRAELLLRKMITDGLSPNAATFNTVIMAQTEGKSPNFEKAVNVFKFMSCSKYVTNARPNRQTYNILIRAFASNRQPADAEAFLKKMRSDGIIPDVDLYTATVAAYERQRKPMNALRLMETMKELGYNFYEVKVLDEAFAKAVRVVNAVGRGLKSMPDESETSRYILSDDCDLDNNDDGKEGAITNV